MSGSSTRYRFFTITKVNPSILDGGIFMDGCAGAGAKHCGYVVLPTSKSRVLLRGFFVIDSRNWDSSQVLEHRFPNFLLHEVN